MHEATVTDVEELAPDVVQLTVAFGEPLHFQPGQWLNFRFAEGVSRAYTIASAPQHPDTVEICVRVGHGRGGEALKKLSRGSTVAFEGPHGDFVLPATEARGVVFLAGDTGIAPVRSIVLHMIATDDPRPIVVLYEPDRRHILYASDFDPLARSGRIVHESGAIETLLSRNRRAVQESAVMAAGFEHFLERVARCVAEIGIDPASVISESFGPEP